MTSINQEWGEGFESHSLLYLSQRETFHSWKYSLMFGEDTFQFFTKYVSLKRYTFKTVLQKTLENSLKYILPNTIYIPKKKNQHVLGRYLTLDQQPKKEESEEKKKTLIEFTKKQICNMQHKMTSLWILRIWSTAAALSWNAFTHDVTTSWN